MNQDAKRKQRRPRRKRNVLPEPVIEWQFIEIPADLIRKMAQLKLAPSEFIFLAYLLSADDAWKQGRSVAMPLRDAQRATGLSWGTIHNAKRGLISKHFMNIENVRNQARTNTYDFSPMRRKLEDMDKTAARS